MVGTRSERDRPAAGPQLAPALLKQELRGRLKELRREVSAEQWAATSSEVAEKLLDRVAWADVRTLHIYRAVPAWREIDTAPIIATVGSQYPRIEIVCPGTGRAEPIPEQRFDLIVVPVLGFDDENFRLGLGAGFYDRFLATQPQALKVGLAYRSARLADGVPVEPHDVPLDEIISG